MPDVRDELLAERRRLLPWENEHDARAKVQALAGRTPAELTALLSQIRGTENFDESVAWLDSAGEGLPRALYESALLLYRDTRVLTWADSVTLARLLAYAPPRFRDFELDRSAAPAGTPTTAGKQPIDLSDASADRAAAQPSGAPATAR